MLDSEAGSTSLGTAYTESQSFTPGAITIDGIAVKVGLRTASPASNTISVRLAQGGSLVAGTEVTINVSDIPEGTNVTTINAQGWVFFKFASPVTLLAATPYTVSAKTSVTTQVTLFRNATAGNWSRMLRTTTTGAPAAGDTMHVIGEKTGAGTGNAFTVTMNETATTDYGPGTDGSVALTVGSGGTLDWGTTASTNYYLKVSGDVVVYGSGIFQIGTTGTPIPRSSTAVLEFDPVAHGGMGIRLRAGSTFIGQGQSRTSGKSAVSCLLSANASAAATSLTVDTDTGWLNGDTIVIASTSRTPAETESRTLTANAGASTLSVGALTNAHGGSSPIEAEIILLTRNVVIRTTNSGRGTFMVVGAGTTAGQLDITLDLDYVQFQYAGTVTANLSAITPLQAAGASGTNVQYCSFELPAGTTGTVWSGGGGTHSHVFSNNVLWASTNTNSTSQSIIDLGASGAAGAWTFTNNIVLGANTGGRIIVREAGNCSGVRVAGLNGTMTVTPGASQVTMAWTGVVIHSVGSTTSWTGITGTITGFRFWRNVGTIAFGAGCVAAIFDSGLFFGSTLINVTVSTLATIWFKNCIIAGDTTFSTPRGVELNDTSGRALAIFSDCQIGVASGIYTSHISSDIRLGTAAGNSQTTILRNTTLGSTTEVETQTNMTTGIIEDPRVGSQKHDGVSGSYKSWLGSGTIVVGTTFYRTTSPSERLTPNNASLKLKSGVKRFAVSSGGAATIEVYVRESVSGDGTDYNGNRARLYLKANTAAGVTEQVLSTATIASEGAWEKLTGVTPTVTEDCVLEVFVDCDGTTGWINVDDWSISGAATQVKALKSWTDGMVGDILYEAAASGGGFF